VAWKKLFRSPTTPSICKPSVIGSYSHLRTLGASVYEPTFPSCRGDCASFRWLQSLHHANMQSFMAGHHAGIDAWSDICRQSRFDRSRFHPVQKTSLLPRVAWLAASDLVTTHDSTCTYHLISPWSKVFLAPEYFPDSLSRDSCSADLGRMSYRLPPSEL